IQDDVELALMRAGEHKGARSYVLYREERAQARAAKQAAAGAEAQPESTIHVNFDDGSTHALDRERLERVIGEACTGIDGVTAEQVLQDTLRNVYDGISEDELSTALVLSRSEERRVGRE